MLILVVYGCPKDMMPLTALEVKTFLSASREIIIQFNSPWPEVEVWT